ncbi:hypothetical protein [Nocardia sp. NPDC051981]|uniref:hypothetical protein n=1 Tax=Nocardia sp. NPDC051981 TaxID=3155417 RepID=UPI003441DDF5
MKRLVIAMVTVVTALGVAACGSGDKNVSKPAKPSTSKTAPVQSNYPPVLTAADLDAELQKLVNPDIPNDQKLDMLQGVAADPGLPQRFVDFYKQSNATITVTGVNDLGNGTLTADAEASISGGQPQRAVVPLVAEDGKWKVQKEWLCNMLSLGNQTSPACG